MARPRMEHFLAEAIEAERATGRAEETVEEAKRHLLVRLVRIIAGAVLVVVGLILMVLPGPGLVVVVAGLVLLAQDVPFARRLLDVARDRLPQDESGKLPRSTIALMVAGCTLGLSASIWWTFLRN